MINIHKRNQVEFESEKVNDNLSKKASIKKLDFPALKKTRYLASSSKCSSQLNAAEQKWRQRLLLKSHFKTGLFGNTLSSLTFVFLSGIFPF